MSPHIDQEKEHVSVAVQLPVQLYARASQAAMSSNNSFQWQRPLSALTLDLKHTHAPFSGSLASISAVDACHESPAVHSKVSLRIATLADGTEKQ